MRITVPILAAALLCGCATHPSVRRYVYQDTTGCYWIKWPDETAPRPLYADGEAAQFCQKDDAP